MFRGITQIALDEKGRMAMPTRYREIGDPGSTDPAQWVVTIDTEERCLLLYPLAEWENIERKIEELPSFNRTARRVQRLLIGHATEVSLDGNGRILIPPPLRDYAGLQKRLVLVGQGKKFEIWDENHWEKQRDVWMASEMQEGSLPAELRDLSL